MKQMNLLPSNLLNVGNNVQVSSIDDDTADKTLLNKQGKIVELNTNGLTGNTKRDPLYVIDFGNIIESFWGTELTLIS